MKPVPEVVRMPRTVVNRVLAHAQSVADREICGLIGAVAGHPRHVYPVANVSHDPARRFEMAPKEQVDVMRRMRESGEDLYAIYHSHPDASALPSATDIREDAYPDTLKLIVSLSTRGVLEMRAFAVGAGRVREIPLELET